MDINRVELKGRITIAPKSRITKNGKEWVTFTIATNTPINNGGVDPNIKNETISTYTNIVVFNPSIIKHMNDAGLKQGSVVWVLGRLFAKVDKEKPITRTFTSVVAEIVEVIKTGKEKEILVNPNEQSEEETSSIF